MPSRVLLVEPDHGVREWLAWLLATENIQVTEAAGGPGALAALRDVRPGVVVIDPCQTGPSSGAMVLRDLRRFDPDLPIVVYTDPATAALARHAPSVAHIVIKGARGLDDLIAAVQSAQPSSSSTGKGEIIASSPRCPLGEPRLAAASRQIRAPMGWQGGRRPRSGGLQRPRGERLQTGLVEAQ